MKVMPKIPLIVSALIIGLSLFGIIFVAFVPRLISGEININLLCALLFAIVEQPARIGILSGFSIALAYTKFKLIYSERWRIFLTALLGLAGLAWSIILYISNLPLPNLIIEALRPDTFQLILFHFNYTHFGSTLTFVLLFTTSALMTKKPLLALVLTLGCIGVTEFICVPLHYIFLNGAFMGIAWYLPFTIAFYPFLISIPKFKLTHKRAFCILLFSGFALTAVATMNAAIGWDIIMWDSAKNVFVSRPLNELVGGIGLTIHHLICRSSKVLIAIPFLFIRLKDPEEADKN